jgi:hypothetical protein
MLEQIKKIKDIELTLKGGFALATIWLWIVVLAETTWVIIKYLISLI